MAAVVDGGIREVMKSMPNRSRDNTVTINDRNHYFFLAQVEALVLAFLLKVLFDLQQIVALREDL